MGDGTRPKKRRDRQEDEDNALRWNIIPILKKVTARSQRISPRGALRHMAYITRVRFGGGGGLPPSRSVHFTPHIRRSRVTRIKPTKTPRHHIADNVAAVSAYGRLAIDIP